ncbi:MAG: hypothetical protein H6573_10470 [Lewinellaceae bacterium]|nr:hypothetical protein [Lewinellaceae bacterium]
MKKIKTYLALIFSILLVTSCKDYLDVQPENVISEDNLEIEELVVNAYSALDYRFNTGEFRDNWYFLITLLPIGLFPISGAATPTKAGGVGDNPGGGMHALEIHQVFPSSENVYNLWRALYFALFR